MRYGRRTRATHTVPVTTTTTTARPSFMSRFRRRPAVYAEGHPTATTGTAGTGITTTNARTGRMTRRQRRDHRAGVQDGHHAGGLHMGTHGGTTAYVHHHKRHVTIGDKISGAMLKLKGSLTHRPGVKAAGTRRMHGTDGRGSHRVAI